MRNTGSRFNDSIVSGIAGAATLTAVHQAARAVSDSAPRMDVVGMRALARSTRAARSKQAGSTRSADSAQAQIDEDAHRTHKGLYRATLAGDLICNSAYYSLATNYTRGAAMGLLAGIGALVLPQRLGLGAPPRSDLLSNQVMTVAWYTLGGLAAAATSQWLARRRTEASGELVGV